MDLATPPPIMTANWDFKLAHAFSRAFRTDSSDGVVASTTVFPESQYDAPKSLGDFTRVYNFLGCATVGSDITRIYMQRIKQSDNY